MISLNRRTSSFFLDPFFFFFTQTTEPRSTFLQTGYDRQRKRQRALISFYSLLFASLLCSGCSLLTLLPVLHESTPRRRENSIASFFSQMFLRSARGKRSGEKTDGRSLLLAKEAVQARESIAGRKRWADSPADNLPFLSLFWVNGNKPPCRNEKEG